MLIRTLLTVVIALFANIYAFSQERGGGAAEDLRQLVREEVRKALGDRGTRWERLQLAVPAPGGAVRIQPPASPGTGSARRAIDAAERAVEADRSLTKAQRVAALKALDAARRAVSKTTARTRPGRKTGKAGRKTRKPPRNRRPPRAGLPKHRRPDQRRLRLQPADRGGLELRVFPQPATTPGGTAPPKKPGAARSGLPTRIHI